MLIGQIRPISLYTSKTLGQSGSSGQSGSRVTGVPGRVGSRVNVTDPVPSLLSGAGNATANSEIGQFPVFLVSPGIGVPVSVLACGG